ncbi:Putative periplasmic protein contains a proteinprenylyl transferase domain protein [Salmonella bongori]|nr:Putative periplasmic protein contains a proteinprenylyl transferase domain protein [Salmonella bongori]
MSSNFRHHLLSLSLLVGIAAPWAAFAQAPISSVGSGSVEDRVTQLERISNAHSQLLTQLQQQLSDNQSDIDSLRGQIQENQYQLNQVIERQKQILLQLGNLNNSGAAQTTDGAQSGRHLLRPRLPRLVRQRLARQYRLATRILITMRQLRWCRITPARMRAIVAFQNFIKKYPDSTYQPNANYWLGQLNYNKGKKDDAAYYFASVVKNYPKSPKAADAMYKVGVIMQDKGDTAKAKAVYQQVISKYPGTDGAKQAQKRLNAM